jgi:2'-5' RNA ligase
VISILPAGVISFRMRSTLWLVPVGSQREELRRLIDDLARETTGPSFEPHVTLLGGLSGSPQEIARRVAPLAADLPLLHVGRVETGDTRHRSVFFSIEPSGELVALRAEIASRLGAGARKFSPHLSVVYGDHSPRVRRAIASDPRLASWTRVALAAVLEVWSTEGPEEGWQRLAR